MAENKIAEETLSNKLGLENNGGDNVVVTTTTIVEKTEISAVDIVKESEILKNQVNKKGVFGSNLVDGDEGRMVNLSENGDTLAMDADELLGGENGIEMNRLFDIGDPMEVCETRDKQGIDEMVADIFEWKDEFTENDNVENKVEQDEIEEDEDHDFVVGDFVWGKIKTHSWWPGQIYNSSDASDYANSIKCKGGLLVAYFGDGSFSWCLPSQLKPFIENFQDMSKQSHSKKFVNAVNKALEQVSKLVGSQLMCKCQTVDLGGVKNSGIKDRVCPPTGNTIRVLMEQLQPVEIVSMMNDTAIMGSDTRLFDLELTVLKSYLNAFYHQKGGCLFGKCIEGLEDGTKGINGPSENGDDRKIKKVKTSNNGGYEKRKMKGLMVNVKSESDNENGDGFSGGEDGMMSPRQRKKSKYLSPPYFSPVVAGGKLSTFGSGSFKVAKTGPDYDPELDFIKVKNTVRKSSQKRRAREHGSDSKADKVMIDADVDANNVLNGLLRAARDPLSFVEKKLPEIIECVLSFRRSNFRDGKKDDSTVQNLVFIKQKLESMCEIVKRCKASDMNANVKGSLEAGLKEVLEKVGNISG